MAAKEWSRSGSFMKKPASGWLHADESLTLGDGMFYPVKYVGSIPFERSMRDLNFEARTDVTREAITRCCEAAAVKPQRQRQVNSIVSTCLLDPPQVKMLNVKFTISTIGIALVVIETNEVIAEHIMPNISFATGGDAEDHEFIGYVAKDASQFRECHVFDCGDHAADIIATIGQAFELRFKSFLKRETPLQPANAAPGPRVAPTFEGHSLYDAASAPPGSELYDDLPGEQQVISQPGVYGEDSYGDPAVNTYDTTSSVAGDPAPISMQAMYGEDPTYDTAGSAMGIGSEYNGNREVVYDDAAADGIQDYDDTIAGDDADAALEMAPPTEDERTLTQEIWFFTGIGRLQAEQLLVGDGDFLVRESMNEMGQYILTVLQDGYFKHLLLVDPLGRVRTATQQFTSPSHLINYHIKTGRPIQSRGSVVYLMHPVANDQNIASENVLYGE